MKTLLIILLTMTYVHADDCVNQYNAMITTMNAAKLELNSINDIALKTIVNSRTARNGWIARHEDNFRVYFVNSNGDGEAQLSLTEILERSKKQYLQCTHLALL